MGWLLWLFRTSWQFFGPGRVPNGYDGCCCSSSSWSCYRFQKMPKALLIRNGKLRNFAVRTHIRDIIPDRSTVLGFSPDGATFRARSTFRTCLSWLLDYLLSIGRNKDIYIVPRLRGDRSQHSFSCIHCIFTVYSPYIRPLVTPTRNDWPYYEISKYECTEGCAQQL